MSDFRAAVKRRQRFDTSPECLTYNSPRPATSRHLRSLLFAPGADERKLAGALASEADAVVADLEDAVAPAEKAGAREARAPASRRAIVRVNGVDTPWFEDDLALVAATRARRDRAAEGDPEAVAALGADGPPVIAIVETAQGLRLAYETASHPEWRRCSSAPSTSVPSSVSSRARTGSRSSTRARRS